MNPDTFQWKTENISMSNNIFDFIKYYNLNIKKKYGQNFLIDNNIIRKIIDAVNVKNDDVIIEIGPGLGALTQFLFDAKKVIAIEIDNDLVKVLRERFAMRKNFELINADVLKLDLAELLRPFSNIKIVSNLPYYISSAVLTKCLELKNLDSMTVMLQKEVGQRIFAKPSTKSYGSLSILSQYYSDLNIITNVSANCFVPKPNVESVVIKFIMKNIDKYEDEKFLFELVRKSFSKRRKTLVNCLENFYGLSKQKITDVLIQNNMDKNIRAEALTLKDFLNLADCIKKIS